MTTDMRMRAVLICIIAVAVVVVVCIAEFAVGMSVGQAGIGVSMIRQMHNHSIARHDSVVKHNCQQNNQTYGFAQHIGKLIALNYEDALMKLGLPKPLSTE